MLFRQGMRILEATVALTANRKSLLPVLPPPLEVQSLHTDFFEVERIAYPIKADGRIWLRDDPSKALRYRLSRTRAVLEGPLTRLSRLASDPRYSLWGNLGFLYRFALFLLERTHRIFSLHACALVDRSANRLFVIIGGAGSGKSVYLLGGLERGLSLFASEMVHFRHEGRRVRWFIGSLADNVRLATLRRHFPRFLPPDTGPPGAEEWTRKTAVDLSSFRYPENVLVDPSVVLLFPRVEEGFGRFTLRRLEDDGQVSRYLFANISEKIGQTTVLYDRIVVPGFDSAELAEARRKACWELAKHRTVALRGSVFCGPRECWGDLLEGGLPPRR